MVSPVITTRNLTSRTFQYYSIDGADSYPSIRMHAAKCPADKFAKFGNNFSAFVDRPSGTVSGIGSPTAD